jgi:Protein of unknown function (DUF4232)
MKHWLWLILPFILAACGGASARPMVLATAAHSQEATQTPGVSATKLYQLTEQAETFIADYPKNNATITAIMAGKYTLGTAVAATMTAQPSDTPLPPVPADAPFCKPADLQASFGSNGATQSILLSAGLKNTGSTGCFLQSWPLVRLFDSQGKALEVDYSYFDIGLGAPGSTATEEAKEANTAKVGLWPGWSVWANLVWYNWCAAPVSGGVVIRLSFQGTGIISIPTDVAGGGTCNAQGQRSYVGIAKLVLVP